MNSRYTIFECHCKIKKKYLLTYDGGSSGCYCLRLCSQCRKTTDNQFLMNEEIII